MGKVESIRKKLEEYNIDAILITSPVNRRYATGFTGTAGVAIISRTEARFITDFRYIEQASEQAAEFTVIKHSQPIHEEVNHQLQQLQINRLGFEEDYVTYSDFKTYQKTFSAELIPVSGLLEDLRIIKTNEELSTMQQAADIADDAFKHILDYIKPGVKEIDISNELEFFMRQQGATSSSFDIIVASGYRAALPHGVASDKEVQSGELVTMDYGALFNGYCSDTTRTVAVGDISTELENIYNTVHEAQKLGVNGIKPGITGKEADILTRDYIESQGYGEYFGHSTGHGLGMDVHEDPSLSPKSDKVLKSGMVVTVEPGIYISDVGGCRIEDDILVTDTGYRRLTNAQKDLIHL